MQIIGRPGEDASRRPIFDILGWKHEVIEDTETDLRFDVDPLGRPSALKTSCLRSW